MELKGVATANLSWELSKESVPVPLQNKLVDHCLLELLSLGDGANHAILRLVFKHPQVEASSRAPANTQGVRMDLALQGVIKKDTGSVEGQLVVKTFTYTGAHRNAAVSHMLPVKGQKAVRHFINVAQQVNLTPCDFDAELFGCRDFM